MVRETVMTGLRICRARAGGSSSALTIAWITACALTAMTRCSPLRHLHNTAFPDVKASLPWLEVRRWGREHCGPRSSPLPFARTGEHHRGHRGGMAERFTAHAWRACSPKGVVGSNPTPSATAYRINLYHQ